MIAKKYNSEIFLILSFVIIIFSNNYFSFEDTLKFGGSDGYYYMMISKFAPNFGENIEYIKGERFFFPFLIGVISNLFDTDQFFLYQFFSIILCGIFIILLNNILISLNLSENIKFICYCLVLFNPYLLRYFIAIPTLLIDLIFLISIQIITLSFLKEKKFLFFLGLCFALLSRQNGLFILLSLLIVKFFFKEKSFFSLKNTIFYIVVFLIIYFLNLIYAYKSQGDTQSIESLYHSTLFGIFYFDYNFSAFLRYIFFPLLSFGPMILFCLISFYFFKINKLNNELLVFLLILAILIIGIAFLGGPNITGKNLTRLSNFSYLNILVSINIVYFQNLTNNFKMNAPTKYLILIISFLWSLHPTFSRYEIFYFLKDIITF